MTETTTKELFWREVMAYRPMLMRAVAGIVGDTEAKGVSRRLVDMEASGGYIQDPKILQELGAFLVGRGEDLGFYVFTLLNKDTALKVRDSGLIVPLGVAVENRPVFLYWEGAIEQCAARVSSYGLPKYFVPWLHEFGHFLCYCLQERPLMAGIAVLCSALKERGYPVRVLRDVEATQKKQEDETVREMGRVLAQLTALNEAMAVWWESQLLREMALEAGDYLKRKKANNPYIEQLEAETREGCLAYIRHWDRATYHPDPFSRAFAGSFQNMKMDRWAFLGHEVGNRKSEVGRKRDERPGKRKTPTSNIERPTSNEKQNKQRADDGGQMTEGYLSGKRVAILGAGSVLGRNLEKSSPWIGESAFQ